MDYLLRELKRKADTGDFDDIKRYIRELERTVTRANDDIEPHVQLVFHDTPRGRAECADLLAELLARGWAAYYEDDNPYMLVAEINERTYVVLSGDTTSIVFLNEYSPSGQLLSERDATFEFSYTYIQSIIFALN